MIRKTSLIQIAGADKCSDLCSVFHYSEYNILGFQLNVAVHHLIPLPRFEYIRIAKLTNTLTMNNLEIEVPGELSFVYTDI